MSLTRRAAFAAPLLAGGCATLAGGSSAPSLTPAQAAALWAIALGLAQVAAAFVPGLSIAIQIAQAIVTPALNDASQTGVVIAQANALTLAAAPHIKAVAHRA